MTRAPLSSLRNSTVIKAKHSVISPSETTSVEDNAPLRNDVAVAGLDAVDQIAARPTAADIQAADPKIRLVIDELDVGRGDSPTHPRLGVRKGLEHTGRGRLIGALQHDRVVVQWR